MSADQQTLFERLKTRAFDHPLIAIAVIAGSTLLFSKSILDASVGMLETLHLREPRELVIARNTESGLLLRDLSQLAYRRIFWANSYVARMKRGASVRDIDYAWDRYIDTVQDWSASLLTNRARLEALFGNAKLESFNNDVDLPFKGAHQLLVEIRYSRTKAAAKALDDASNVIDRVNTNVFFLVTGLQAAEAQKRGLNQQ